MTISPETRKAAAEEYRNEQRKSRSTEDKFGLETNRSEKPKRKVVLKCASDIEPEKIEFLMDGYLARGKLHILAGSPGVGKTTLLLALAAKITNGSRLPTGEKVKPGNIVLWTGEDSPENTIVPRFLASGGDRNRLFVIHGVMEGEEPGPFDPSKDMASLKDVINQIGGCELIIIDPIVSAVAGDSHKNSETRRALQPVVDLAATTNAAVVGVSHLTKGTAGRDPVERINGSLAFGALARVVLLASKEKEPDDGSPRRNLLLRGKSNISEDTGGFMYSLVLAPVPGYPHLGDFSIVRFEERIDGSARELLAMAEEQPDISGDGSAMDEAKEFLIDLLSSGPKTWKEIKTAANSAGVPDITLRRAKSALGVFSSKNGYQGVWKWALPKDDQVKGDHKDTQPQKDERLWSSVSAFGNINDLRGSEEECHNPLISSKMIKSSKDDHVFGSEHLCDHLCSDGGVDI